MWDTHLPTLLDPVFRRMGEAVVGGVAVPLSGAVQPCWELRA